MTDTMIGNEVRNLIYACAILHRIPSAGSKRRFEQLLAKGDAQLIQPLLEEADHYTLTKYSTLNAGFGFVASPFEYLNQAKGERHHQFHIAPLEMSLERDLFPKPGQIDGSAAFLKLWTKFDAAIEGLDWSPTALQATAEFTLSLLFDFATAIPNPGSINQEVSWYDYAKVKAGLAVCLYDSQQAQEGENDPFLLIRADMSGIQSFIYDIVSKHASKNLKGRSFYIQLLSDAVLRVLLRDLALYEGNVMYSSGGNFFLVAPNINRVKVAFADARREIEQKLFKEHGTQIAVVMGYQAISRADMEEGRISGAIKRLFEESVEENKKRKFSTLLASEYGKFFEPLEEGGEAATDLITGEEIRREEKDRVYKVMDSPLPKKIESHETGTENENDEIGLIREVTAKQIFLGHQLRQIDYLIVTDSALVPDTDSRYEKCMVHPCCLGFRYYIVKKGMEDAFDKLLQRFTGKARVWAINHFKEKRSEFVKPGVCSMLYGGNDMPVLLEDDKEDKDRTAGNPKYFDEMAGDSSIKRLAVLRMDVDGLGKVFKEAKPQYLTFSYYAALSRSLDWFFKGYLNKIWAQSPYCNDTQIIYSGGDDLFVIGRWNFIIDFAEEIKKTFSEYTCGSMDDSTVAPLTLSGGISIVTDKFPIMKAADFAASAEHSAKMHQLRDDSGEIQFAKNSISLLGKPLHWDTEYKLVKELKDELGKYLDSKDGHGGLPLSVLSKIQTYAEMARRYDAAKKRNELLKEHGKPLEQQPAPQWVWQIVYDFSRLIERTNKSAKEDARKVRDQLDDNIKAYLKEQLRMTRKLKNAVFTNTWNNRRIESSYHFIELLSIAARWAELEKRQEKKEENKDIIHS